MELILSRSQRETGMINRKVAFTLHARVNLDDEEQRALEKYKFYDAVIYHKENVTADPSGEKVWRNLAAGMMNLTLTVNGLIIGKSIECKDIVEMMSVEDEVKTACGNLKQLLEAASGFEGETTISY